MDKTFAETQGQAPFDWNKWLDDAIANEPTAEEFRKAHVSSMSWVTCACGNQCAIIRRGQSGYPLDSMLFNLGDTFCSQIGQKCWSLAKNTLAKIEARSKVLIAEELGNLSSLRFLDTGRDEE